MQGALRPTTQSNRLGVQAPGLPAPQCQWGRGGVLGKPAFYSDPLILPMLPQGRRGAPAGMEEAPGAGLRRPCFQPLLGTSS